MLGTTYLPAYEEIFQQAPWLGSFRFAGQNIGQVVSALLPYFFAFAGIGLLIYLLVGGFKLLTSAGNPKNIAAGQQIIVNALVGFLIVIASFWTLQIVKTVFNINLETTGSPPPSQQTCAQACSLNSFGCRSEPDCNMINGGVDGGSIGETSDCPDPMSPCCCQVN